MKRIMTEVLLAFRRRWSFWRSKPLFSYAGLSWEISPGVVNPTLFTASEVFAKQVLRWLPDEPVTLLELGCGSGFAGLLAAGRGHHLTALDIDPVAVTCAQANADRNRLKATILQSDWAQCLPDGCVFERIICNPPFLKGTGGAFATALKAGENWEVLDSLVRAIFQRLAPEGRALVMTSSQTDRQAWLQAVASVGGLKLAFYARKQHWQEQLLFDEISWSRASAPIPRNT